MIQRQWVENLVFRREVEDRAHLCHVGNDGMVRQHHSFGPVFRAGSEQNHRGIERGLPGNNQPRKSQRETNQPQLVAPAEAVAQVLEIDDVAAGQRVEQRMQVRLLDELARSDHGANTGRNARAFYTQRPCRVIENCRHPPGCRQAHDHTHRRDHVRKQHADVFAGAGKPLEQPRQRQAHAQNLAVSLRLLVLIFDQQRRAPVRRDRIEKALEQRLAGV